MRAVMVLLFPFFLAGCPAESPPSPAPEPSIPAVAAPVPSPGTQEATAFEGVWTTRDNQDGAFEILIFPNGQALTNWSGGIDGAKGQRGFWRRDGNRLLAVYEDGWTDVLEPDATGFVHKGFSPGTSLGGRPTNSAPAQKFADPAAAFVGVWRMNREPDGSYQYIALFADGRARSTVDGGTDGRWELVEDGVRCTWPKDGWVDRITRGPEGWKKRSWVGAESDLPADVSPVVRVGVDKFSLTP